MVPLPYGGVSLCKERFNQPVTIGFIWLSWTFTRTRPAPEVTPVQISNGIELSMPVKDCPLGSCSW